ncbi:MAG: type II toxin-antitoxin system RelE/ParE family toxin [Chitinophagales bacterium]|nr:type II toxin-antitoxin system RelE/ParE family toxin [Chitinophagales bacterium]
MPFTVIVKQEAHQDTIDAYNYYEEKLTGLGERFLAALQQRYKELSANPTFYSYIDEDPLKILRDVKLEKFPFVVVYEIIEPEVVVYAVHNTYKHPRNKLRKI